MHVFALATQSTGALLFVEQRLYAYQPCARLWRWRAADDKTRCRLLQSRRRISRGFYAIASLFNIQCGTQRSLLCGHVHLPPSFGECATASDSDSDSGTELDVLPTTAASRPTPKPTTTVTATPSTEPTAKPKDTSTPKPTPSPKLPLTAMPMATSSPTVLNASGHLVQQVSFRFAQWIGTHQTAICHLNNYLLIGSAYGPTLPAGWTLVAPPAMSDS